jgi:ribosomal protein S18 acetylase RimI-like enzyme
VELAELARWIELAEGEGMAAAVLAARARGEDGAVEAMGVARLIYAGPGSPFSKAVGLGFEGEVTPEAMARVRAFYAERGTTAALQLCPYAHPSLLDRAREAGFGVLRFVDVLTRPLPGGEALERLADGLELRAVDPSDPEQVLRAAQVLARAYADGDEPPESELRLEQMMIRQPDALALLAWRDGAPVGGAMMGWGRDRIVLIAGAVLPEHRRRGVQTALMRERLRLGQERGARLAVVTASPGVGTRRNAERLGFRLAYTRVTLVERS